MSIYTAADVANREHEQKHIAQFEGFIEEMTQSWNVVDRATAIRWVLEAGGVGLNDTGFTACEKIKLPLDKYEQEFNQILNQQGLKVA